MAAQFKYILHTADEAKEQSSPSQLHPKMSYAELSYEACVSFLHFDVSIFALFLTVFMFVTLTVPAFCMCN